MTTWEESEKEIHVYEKKRQRMRLEYKMGALIYQEGKQRPLEDIIEDIAQEHNRLYLHKPTEEVNKDMYMKEYDQLRARGLNKCESIGELVKTYNNSYHEQVN